MGTGDYLYTNVPHSYIMAPIHYTEPQGRSFDWNGGGAFPRNCPLGVPENSHPQSNIGDWDTKGDAEA